MTQTNETYFRDLERFASVDCPICLGKGYTYHPGAINCDVCTCVDMPEPLGPRPNWTKPRCHTCGRTTERCRCPSPWRNVEY